MSLKRSQGWKQDAARHYENGMTLEEVGQLYGVSKQYILIVLQELGIKRRPTSGYPHERKEYLCPDCGKPRHPQAERCRKCFVISKDRSELWLQACEELKRGATYEAALRRVLGREPTLGARARLCAFADEQGIALTLTKNCRVCGKKFQTPRSKYQAAFCSEKCREEDKKKVWANCESCGAWLYVPVKERGLAILGCERCNDGLRVVGEES